MMQMSQMFVMNFFMILTFISGSGPETISGKIEIEEAECIDCHSDLVEHEVIHPVMEGDCEDCHQPTGESHPLEGTGGFILVDTIPALCYYCHEELTPKVYGHQPVDRNRCLSCHDVHGSSEPMLLIVPEKELCLSCHESIKQKVNSNNVTHAAITDGGCIICHQPHGSGNYAMLIAQYPSRMYVPAEKENFELCFMCHSAELMDEKETEWGTNFRNGLTNLHSVHINGNKGRNCRLCHNMHGSSSKFLIEERVKFGRWEMRMNFSPSEKGGSCLPGCHGKKYYER